MGTKVIRKAYLNIFNEYIAAEDITPGMLIERTSSAEGKVQKHSTEGGHALVMVANEDTFLGKDATEVYESAEDAVVQCWTPGRGDVAKMLVAASVTLSIGTPVMSAGDGTLKAWTSGNTVIGYSEEAVTTSEVTRVDITIA